MNRPRRAFPAGWIGPRGRRILHTGSWSLAAKAAAAANLFIAVPFVLETLGPAQFGAWATLVSLVVFAGFLDFGFGNGAMNLVAAAQGRGDGGEVVAILREARRTLASVSIALAVAAAIALPLVPWHRLLGLPEASSGQCRAAAAAVLFAVALAVPLNLAARVQLGLGFGDRGFRWQAIGQLLALGGVVLLAKSGASLAILTAASVGIPLLAAAANTRSLARTLLPPNLRPARQPALASRIRREGMLFFFLQLAAALAYSADLPLIASLRGPIEAGNYALAQRLFSVIPLGLGLVWTPLWPIYRHALASGDHQWVRDTLRRSVFLAFGLAFAGAILLAVVFVPVVGLWIHRDVGVSVLLLTGFVAWTTLDATGTALSTFLNAASVMRYQLIVAGLFAVTCFSAKIFVLHSSGIALVPWATVVTYLVFFMIPTMLMLRRLVGDVLRRRY